MEENIVKENEAVKTEETKTEETKTEAPKRKKEYSMTALKRDMLINRIIGCVTLFFAIAACVIFIIIGIEITCFVKEAKPVIDMLSQVDIDELNGAIVSINHIIDTLKIDEMMDTIDKIGGMVEGIDPENFETTLDNLNKASDTLQAISSKLSPLLSIFKAN